MIVSKLPNYSRWIDNFWYRLAMYAGRRYNRRFDRRRAKASVLSTAELRRNAAQVRRSGAKSSGVRKVPVR